MPSLLAPMLLGGGNGVLAGVRLRADPDDMLDDPGSLAGVGTPQRNVAKGSILDRAYFLLSEQQRDELVCSQPSCRILPPLGAGAVVKPLHLLAVQDVVVGMNSQSPRIHRSLPDRHLESGGGRRRRLDDLVAVVRRAADPDHLHQLAPQLLCC